MRIEFEQQDGNQCMKDAIQMVNFYINLPEFEMIRDKYFNIDRLTLARQIARVKFIYVRHEDCYKEGHNIIGGIIHFFG